MRVDCYTCEVSIHIPINIHRVEWSLFVLLNLKVLLYPMDMCICGSEMLHIDRKALFRTHGV